MPRDPRDIEELEALRAQLREVLARLDTALAQNAAVLAQNAELVELVAKLNERIAELLPVAKRKARKSKPTTPSEATPPTMTEEQRRAFENRPRPPVKPPKGPAQRSAAKPTGRSAVPQHLEAEEQELRFFTAAKSENLCDIERQSYCLTDSVALTDRWSCGLSRMCPLPR
ncbi:MAG TPA: hypothetical protein VFX59_13010 [Polyangiales bacterium]|nr:hypothetical protein [Polyangiales bacterium]